MSGFWVGKKVVVPGGAGFIGSHVVEWLDELGAEVVAVDDLSNGDWSRLGGASKRIRKVEGDVNDNSLLDNIFPGADVVMNLAGVAPGLTLDEGRHQHLHDANVRIAGSVLQAVLRHRIPRLLVVSSSCVYPDDAPVPTPEMDLTGNLPEAANLGYGLAKREIEQEAMRAAEEHPDIRIAIARPFNVYGARDSRSGPGAHVIPSLLGKVLSDDPEIVVWGSGRQTRSFIHAKDMARALALVTEHHALADPVNIGDASEIPLGELVELLMELCGSRKPICFDTSKPEGALRKGADISKLHGITGGFHAAVRFEDGLRELVETRLAETAAC